VQGGAVAIRGGRRMLKHHGVQMLRPMQRQIVASRIRHALCLCEGAKLCRARYVAGEWGVADVIERISSCALGCLAAGSCT